MGMDHPHGTRTGLRCMQAVHAPRRRRPTELTVPGPRVLDVVGVPEPEAGDGQKLDDVYSAGINDADAHHPLSVN